MHMCIYTYVYGWVALCVFLPAYIHTYKSMRWKLHLQLDPALRPVHAPLHGLLPAGNA